MQELRSMANRKTALAAAMYFAALGGILYRTTQGLERVKPIYQELKERQEFINQRSNHSISNALDVIKPKEYSLEDRIRQNAELLAKNEGGRKITLENAFSNATQFSDYTRAASIKTGLDENLLIAIMTTESKSDLRAVSKAGAGGLMQLMPRTAHYQGLKIEKFTDERFSPESILAGATYFKEQLDLHKGLPLALAAYNLGPTALKKIVDQYGKDWSKIEQYLPHGTRDYVVRVLSKKIILDNAESYGLNIKQIPLYSEAVNNSIVHSATKGETLHRISRTYGVPVQKIKEINPTIRDYSRIRKGQRIFIPRG